MRKVSALLSFGLFAGLASATPVVIDSFTDSQAVLSVNVGTPTQSGFATGTLANIIGGARWASITQVTNGGGTDTLDIANTVSGFAVDSNASGDVSNAVIKWDGSTTSPLVFGNYDIDLTGAGANNQITLGIRSDLSSPNKGSIIIYKDAGDFSTATFNYPGNNILTNESLLFTSFTNTGTGADFQHVHAVQLLLPGIDSLDLRVDFVQSDSSGSPEPASMILFGSGFTGLAMFLRRRKA